MESRERDSHRGRAAAWAADALLLFAVRAAAIAVDLLLLAFGLMAASALLHLHVPVVDESGRYAPPVVQVFLMLCAAWLYFALQECSRRGGTVGKRLFRIKVARLDGARVSFLRATLRFLAKLFLSWVLFIGYLLALITPRRRALHDLIAGTVVLKRGPEDED